jgi:uncharacterized protein (TIGR02217 family)
MSNALYPTLPGLTWGITKTPIWSTQVQKAVNGRELRAAYFSYPNYKIKLKYEFLRSGAQAELQTLMGFYNARLGSFDSFLLNDTSDNTVLDQGFGTGNGVKTQFKLVRSYGGFSEPIAYVNGAAIIKSNGTVVSNYTITNGVVTFAAAPAVGAVLTWSGGFYYRVRFASDTLDFQQLYRQLWSAGTVDLITVKA